MIRKPSLTAGAPEQNNRKSRRFMVGAMVACCVVKLGLLLGVVTMFT